MIVDLPLDERRHMFEPVLISVGLHDHVDLERWFL